MPDHLHRPGTCSVCGAAVIIERYAPRTYEPWDLDQPHYCQNEDVKARLDFASAMFLRRPEPVAKRSAAAYSPRPPMHVPEAPPLSAVYDMPEYQGVGI